MNSRVVAIATAVPILLFLLYVLSTGPILWLIAHGYLPVWVSRAYAPIWSLPVIGDFINWELQQIPP